MDETDLKWVMTRYFKIAELLTLMSTGIRVLRLKRPVVRVVELRVEKMEVPMTESATMEKVG